MSNLSKQKREKLLEFLNELKIQHDDDSSMFLINEIENELKEKKYGLVWEEHSENVDEMLVDSIPIFKEIDDKKIESNKGEPYNFLLEGDNLHSLKLLQKTHKGKIDIIYIDPPYNTKNKEFIYDDSMIGEDDGYRHSKWLSFMYKRLSIAKELLASSGVIFISIDDNEHAPLKILCDKIFREENFISNICRQAIKGGSRSENIKTVHDYILVYAKSKNEMTPFTGFEKQDIEYSYVDEKGSYAIGRELNKWGAGSRREDSPTMWFPIKGPNGEKVYPIRNDGSDGRWRWGKSKLLKAVEENEVVFKLRDDGTYIVYEKIRELKNNTLQFNTWFENNYINAKGSEALKKIFNTLMSVFDYAKPVELIHDLCFMANNKNAIILDFFAGSGTTAQAVMELNKLDNGSRKYILCTDNYNKICEEITYPRIKAIIQGYNYKGKIRNSLYKVKLTVSNLKKMDTVLSEMEDLKNKKSNEFDSFEIKSLNGYVELFGVNNIEEKTKGLKHNLKYYKTDFIKKLDSDEMISDKMLKNIYELIELEHHIEIDNHKYIVLYDEDNLSGVINRIENKGKLFISPGIFLSRKEKKILDDKEATVIEIPEYYFKNELREVGEL